MGFTHAVSSVFRHYAAFYGRARRSEFWYWTLFRFLCTLVFGAAFAVGYVLTSVFALDAGGRVMLVSALVAFVFFAATLIPDLAVRVRRMHDTGKSGLRSLIPAAGSLCMIVLSVLLALILLGLSPIQLGELNGVAAPEEDPTAVVAVDEAVTETAEETEEQSPSTAGGIVLLSVLALFCLAWFVLFFLPACRKGDPVENRWGPSPYPKKAANG